MLMVMAAAISAIPSVLSSEAPSTCLRSCTSRRDKSLFGAGLSLSVVVIPGERKQKRSSIRAYTGVAQPLRVRDGVNLTLYDLLGISKHVTLKEIKMAYREKARQYHPDVNPPSEEEECTRKFLEVQKAFGVLGNPSLRARYDYTIRYDLSTRALRYGVNNGAENFGRIQVTPNRATVISSPVRMPSYSPEEGESRFRCSYEMAC